MNQDEIKTNLLDVDQWIRILFMALFAVAAWLILIGLIVLVLVQTLIMLVSGEPNRNLQKAAYMFGCYLQELIQFMAYNTNKKPYPFADFPNADNFDSTAEADSAEAARAEAESPKSSATAVKPDEYNKSADASVRDNYSANPEADRDDLHSDDEQDFTPR